VLTSSTFVLGLTVMYGLGFLAPIVVRRRRFAVDFALCCGLLGSTVAAAVTGGIAFGLLTPLPASVIVRSLWVTDGPVKALDWEVQVDPLAAFFGLLISAFAALVAVYSFAALRADHYRGQDRHIAAGFNLFVWSTLLVVFASQGVVLLIALEAMTLAFGYLTLYKHIYYEVEGHGAAASIEQRKSARLAPQVYLIISHSSTAFLLAAVSLLALRAESLSFAAWIRQSGAQDPPVAWAVFLLALAGLGIRAGLTPAHFWVSLVHPASPTPTHALSLGIAIKVAIYLMYRFFFQFLRPEPGWGYIVLILAAVTALVNVWYAITSHDLKTALAYHSIENIGIIVAPIGVAMIFGAASEDAARWLTCLALTASLYHTLNHAAFKGLLYMATGAIDNLTGGVVELNRLGGLIKLYPWTSAAFLCGAFAIAGFPPWNGFVSEWLTLQTLLRGVAALRAEGMGVLTLVSGLLMLVAAFALTAFCFYKLVGLALLGLPRTSPVERERWQTGEVGAPMLATMAALAILCLLLGILPGQVTPWLANLAGELGYDARLAQPVWSGLALEPVATQDRPLLPIAALLGVAAGLAGISIALRPGRRAHRPAQPWNCGAPLDATTMQATSASLSDLIRHLVTDPTRPSPEVHEYLPTRFMLSDSPTYPQAAYELFREVYNRWFGWLLKGSEKLGNAIQQGDIRRYLSYIFVASLAALFLFLQLRKP
jgi:hydrogenase-4 component B